MAPPVRYVEWVRVSGAAQASRETPEIQRRAFDAMRRSRPGVLVERVDSGTLSKTGAISASKDVAERADVQRLFALSQAKAYDELRVYHVDRLTRHDDPRQRMAIYGAVLDAGAVIVDPGGHVIDPQSEMGEIDYYLQTLFASRAKKLFAKRSREGKDKLAGEGRLVDGRPPWGRRFDGKAWTTTPDATRYLRLFDLALRGLTLPKIAGAMEGTAPRGGPWTPGIVLHLLRAEHATGTYRARGNEIEIPAIVDAATQRRALAAVKRHGKGGRTPSVRALLRLLASCGECGALMRVRAGDDARRYYYACARGCRGWHRVAETDEMVVAELRRWLQHPDVFLAAVAPPPDPESTEKEIRAAEAEVKRIQKAEVEIASLVGDGLLTLRAARPKLRDLQASRLSAAEALQAAQDRAGRAQGAREASREAKALLVTWRGRVARVGWEAWRDLARLLLPRTPETGAVLHEDGEVELRPSLPLDASGIGGAEPRGVPWVSGGRGTTLRLVAQRAVTRLR